MAERSLSFPRRVVEIARRHRLLVVTEDSHVLRPSVNEHMAAISQLCPRYQPPPAAQAKATGLDVELDKLLREK